MTPGQLSLIQAQAERAAAIQQRAEKVLLHAECESLRQCVRRNQELIGSVLDRYKQADRRRRDAVVQQQSAIARSNRYPDAVDSAQGKRGTGGRFCRAGMFRLPCVSRTLRAVRKRTYED